MKSTHESPSLWSTASFGNLPDISPLELAQLGAHLNFCRRTNQRGFIFRCQMERAGGFLTARVVTTAVLIAIAAGMLSLAL